MEPDYSEYELDLDSPMPDLTDAECDAIDLAYEAWRAETDSQA